GGHRGAQHRRQRTPDDGDRAGASDGRWSDPAGRPAAPAGSRPSPGAPGAHGALPRRGVPHGDRAGRRRVVGGAGGGRDRGNGRHGCQAGGGSPSGARGRERAMKLTIFGATGGIGGQLLDQAVAAGHEVTAVVRDPTRLASSRTGVRVVTADLMDPAPGVLESAVAGADAVLSGVGPRPMAKAGVAEQGTRAIVRAMDATGARRLVVVSAAPISTVPSPGRPHPPRRDPGEGFLMRHLLTPFAHTVMRERYADLALMEDVLR